MRQCHNWHCQCRERNIVNVNKFHYHRPCGGGNTTEMSRAFEYMGLLDVARRAFVYFNSIQSPDGAFRLGKLVECDYLAYGDRTIFELLHGMERIASASKWKQQTAAAVADRVAACINSFSL